MNNREWQRNGEKWYLCFDSTLSVFKSRRNATSHENEGTVSLFTDVKTVAKADDVIKTAERVDYRMRLPYSDSMLIRRLERGGDVPTQWRAQVFTVGEAAKHGCNR
jgi:hypothetical protein